MIGRHPKTVLQAWRRAHADGVPLPVPHDPTAVRHYRHLILVLPHGATWDEEYSEIARQLGIAKVQGGEREYGHVHQAGGRPDGSPSQWHQRAGHRSVEHWRHHRDHDHGDEPTLLCEDVAIDLVLRPTATVAVRPTELALGDEWRAITRPIRLHARHPDGDPVDGELHLDGGEVRGLRIAIAATDEWTDVPVADGLARIAMPDGEHRLRVQARGSGVVEDVTLTLGRYVEVERHRRYHRVVLD